MPIKRAPNGLQSAKPIALRLHSDELEVIKRIAAREERSMASVCRLALLKGLAAYERGSKRRIAG